MDATVVRHLLEELPNEILCESDLTDLESAFFQQIADRAQEEEDTK
jgi:hypothetical protein